jgi:F0F1-type ATP synthase assembly protein I
MVMGNIVKIILAIVILVIAWKIFKGLLGLAIGLVVVGILLIGIVLKLLKLAVIIALVVGGLMLAQKHFGRKRIG